MRDYQIGNRSNVIPARAEVTLEFCLSPDYTAKDVERFLGEALEGHPVRYEAVAETRQDTSHVGRDYSFHERVIADVIEELNHQDIDLYLILTAEGCDPVTELIPGIDTIGAGAYLFTKDGKKLAVASAIDAQGLDESGLFDEVIRFQSYDETVASLVRELAPGTIAMDYSETVPICDGLTMGKYAKFIKSMGDYGFEMLSADLFIPKIQKRRGEKNG